MRQGKGFCLLELNRYPFFSREEAVEKLFGCFKDAGDLNDRLRNAMKEDPEGKLLKFNSFVFDAN